MLGIFLGPFSTHALFFPHQVPKTVEVCGQTFPHRIGCRDNMFLGIRVGLLGGSRWYTTW